MKQFKLEEQKAAEEMVLNHFKWQIFCLTTIDPHSGFTCRLRNLGGKKSYCKYYEQYGDFRLELGK